MANSISPTGCDLKRFLRIASITVFSLVILSRLCYILYSATYYDTSISDGLFTLIYHLSNTVYAASRGTMFAVILCGYFLWEQPRLLPTVSIAGGGLLLFHLSAFATDLISGVIAGAEGATLLFLLIQLFTECVLEFAVLILILVIFFRKKRLCTPCTAIFSTKNPPQLAALVYLTVYFLEVVMTPVLSIAEYLTDGGTFSGEVGLDLLAAVIESLMTGFVIPYAVIMLFLHFFLPEKKKINNFPSK